MNKKILLIALAGFLSLSISHATITGVPSWSYSGGLYCYAPVLGVDAGTGDQSLAINGYQSGFGVMGMTVTADSASDPTLMVNESIANTSSFVWTSFFVSIAMNQTFSISLAGVTAPAGWTAATTQPGAPVAGVYTGTIDYVSGTPVAISPAANSTLDYSYALTFTGSTSYSYTETATPVPEPGAFSFLMTGMLLLGGWTVASRRQAKLRVRA
jgi:hypothetical protein